MKRFSKKIGNDVYAWLDPAQCVKRRNLHGGTAPEMVMIPGGSFTMGFGAVALWHLLARDGLTANFDKPSARRADRASSGSRPTSC